MKWFKYMEEQWATELVENGLLRINSLDYFKDLECHGKSVGDDGENTTALYSVQRLTGNFELNEFEKEFIDPSNLKLKEGATIEKCEFVQRRHGIPTYAFCLSDKYSLDIQNRVSEDNVTAGTLPYDTCVKIEEHTEFIKLVSKAMFDTHKFEYYGHGCCFYRDRKIHWKEWEPERQLCPAFVKPPDYRWQNEVRIIFKTSKYNDHEPIDIIIPEIIPLCKII